MNKEEKEAIKIVEDIAFVRGIRQDVEGEREDLLALEEVLNLIDKLQKELDNSINKDIIRDKIKELTGEIHRTKKGRIILKDIKRLAKIEILKELLGG